MSFMAYIENILVNNPTMCGNCWIVLCVLKCLLVDVHNKLVNLIWRICVFNKMALDIILQIKQLNYLLVAVSKWLVDHQGHVRLFCLGLGEVLDL